MNKLRAVLITLALALAMITVTPTTAQAAGTKVVNSSSSAYAINTYTDSYCRYGRYVLQPGRARTSPPYTAVRSVRVNAYSRGAVGTGAYGRLIPPNRCVKITSGVTWVKNYSNA